MMPLEAAQRLAGEAPFIWVAYGRTWRCFFCDSALPVKGARVDEEDFAAAVAAYDAHAPDCMWIALPRIIAALEAAQALIDYGFVAEYFGGDYGEYNMARCGACSEIIDRPSDHAPDCRGMALKAALRGDEAEPVTAQRCRDCHRLLRDHIIMCTGPR